MKSSRLVPASEGPRREFKIAPGLRAGYGSAGRDEHGGLGISGATDRLNIGDKARLIPSPAEEDASPS